MDWREELTARLPPFHEEEPKNLREEIMEELRDHLEMTYRRELLTCWDETEARQRVIETFGNPADIALQLWLDAMKGRLIMNKVALALTCLVAVICCFMIGTMWYGMSLQAQNQRDQLAAIQEQTKMMMENFRLMRDEKKTQPADSTDWRNLSVFLHGQATSDKEVEIHLHGDSAELQDSIEQKAIVGAGEKYDFAVLPTGQYRLALSTPTGFRKLHHFLLGPGRDAELEFTLPENLKLVSLPIQFLVPNDQSLTKGDRVCLQFQINPDPVRADNDKWFRMPELLNLTLDRQANVLDYSLEDVPDSPERIVTLRNDSIEYLPGQYGLASIVIGRKGTEGSNLKYSYPYRFLRPRMTDHEALQSMSPPAIYYSDIFWQEDADSLASRQQLNPDRPDAVLFEVGHQKTNPWVIDLAPILEQIEENPDATTKEPPFANG